jgi:enoyl-CoA hydratase/carnithine racemase
MADDLVLLERRDDGVAVITLNRPKVNALNTALVHQLRAVAEGLTDNPPGAVVVTGGPKVFAAGADISEFGGPDEARAVSNALMSAFNALAAIPRIVIAAVAGYALGGGCELALACDLRIASERAVFGQPEILLGIIPGAGGTQRLPRLVGASRAKEIIVTGRQVAAEEAARIGLADLVVTHEELHDRAFELAAKLASGPLAAHALAKEAIDEGLQRTLHDGLLLERDHFIEVFRTEDSQTGVASFLEHGPGRATFLGR